MLPSDNRPPISAFAVYRQQFKATQKKNAAKDTANKRKLEQTQTSSTKLLPVKKVKKDSSNMKKAPAPVVGQSKKNGTESVPNLVPIDRGDGKEPHHQTGGDDPSLEAAHLFKWLISPMTLDKFLNKHWEKESLHVKRTTRPEYFSHILNSEMLDRIFRNNLLYYTRNVDVVSYENGVKEVHNLEGRAVPSALWDFYANGCSVRLLNPQTYNEKVHFILATLQEYFGTMVGANVYLTPPGSQGFAPHFDDIEAFVVQLEGRKHWKLYRPQDSDVLARDSSHNFKSEELGKPFMELTLNAGEVLYFPRGTIHEGRTDDDAHSLHITISMYQHTAYIDLLEHLMPSVLKSAALNSVDVRKGLPLDYLKYAGRVNKGKKSPQRKLILDNVRNLFKSLIDHVSDAEIDKAADLLGKKFMHDSMPPILLKNEAGRTSRDDGDYLQNGQVHDRVEISPDTKVRLLRYYCIRLVVEENAIKLYYNTENANVYHGEEEQWLELDSSMVNAIVALQKAYPKYLEVEALPMEDITMKLQLISDLWEHGILVTEKPLDLCFNDDTEDESELDE